MEPPFRPWQPIRGILTLIVVLVAGLITFYLFGLWPDGIYNPVRWIAGYSEFNMLLAIFMVFLLLFLNGYVIGWPGRAYTPPNQLGYIGKKFKGWYRRTTRALVHTGILAGLIAVGYLVLRYSVGPNFPWMLFFEITTLFVFLTFALLFSNWPLHKLRQPAQGLGLLGLSFVISAILYYVLFNYSSFYAQVGAAQSGSKAGAAAIASLLTSLGVALGPTTLPYLGSINPNGAYEAFFMATMITMFLLYIVIFYFLFDMWPFRLLRKQPWSGLSALATIVVLSYATWQLLLVIWPKILNVDVGLISQAGTFGVKVPGNATTFVPLSALPAASQLNISELYTLGAFMGPLIAGALIWSVVFLWWPTIVFTRGGRAPYNRQPLKGLILLGLSILTAYLLYVGLQAFAYVLQPPIMWQIPGLIPPPFTSLLWLVIDFLPGLATYILFYAVVWESWPQPALPPPYPDFMLYKTAKEAEPMKKEKKEELASKFAR